MKTYISALLLAGATLTAVSCDRNNDTQIVNDQDTIALVTEAKVSFPKETDIRYLYHSRKIFQQEIMFMYTDWKELQMMEKIYGNHFQEHFMRTVRMGRLANKLIMILILA